MGSRLGSSWLKGIAALLVFLVAGFVPFAFAADVSTTCSAATSRGTNGPADYSSYCWINFAGYNQTDASDADGQKFTIALQDGGSMVFRVRVTTSAATSSSAPSWSGAPFGQTAFVGVSGNPVIYQAVNGSTTNVTLSGITVTPGAGGSAPYAFVAADAESTNNGESVSFTTNGDAWTLLASMQNGGSPLFPTLTGVGTATVSEAGVAGSVGAYAFASSGSPTTVSSTMVGGGLQGIAFGVKYIAADVKITKTHSGTFKAGGTGTYTIKVHNNGPDAYTTANTFTVVDTLPAGLSYGAVTATGWSCSAVGQVGTCTTNVNLANGGDLNDIVFDVNIATTVPASVTNTATISVLDGYDYDASNDTANDVTPIAHPNLTTSTKDVEDVDGGLAKPGDTLRYTINLVETAGIAGVGLQVSDVLAANLGSLTVVSIPVGATNASVGNTLNITGIDLAANGTAAIVFTAVISGAAAPGDKVNNTATIKTSGNVTVGTPAAEEMTVQLTPPPVSGNKYLYFNTDSSLTRARPASGTMALGTSGLGTCFSLAPLAAALNLASSTISVTLRVRRPDTANGNRRLRLRLFQNGTATSLTNTNPADINVGTAGYNSFANATWGAITLNDTAFNSGQYIVACVLNRDSGRPVTLSQNDGGNYSALTLNASTVINVDSVTTYSAAYNATSTKLRYLEGEHAYLRAVVSDPFGNADITGATIVIKDALGTPQGAAGTMTSVATTASTRTYEYDYTVPANPHIGGWTVEVTAKEGGENEVTHTGIGGFPVEGRLSLGKTWVAGLPGDTVSLSVTGGSTTTAGTSTPASTSAATATAVAAATITLTEAFTVGLAGEYTKAFGCVRDKDAVALAVAGSGMSRTITMPADSAVTCTYTNTYNVPLLVVKALIVRSDPVNGTTNPKAIPGAIIEYDIIITNPSPTAIDSNTVFITDPIPTQMELKVADFGGAGSGPVAFFNGSPSSGLSYTFTSLANGSDDIAFSNDGGASWTYTPTPDGDGIDAAVTNLRINPKGTFNSGSAQFTVKFRTRLK